MTARRVLCLIAEAMVSERRAQQIAFAAAAKFAGAGETLTDARVELAEMLEGGDPEVEPRDLEALARMGDIG